ncbi:hemolysin D [Nitrosomonas sp. PY1]|uniref:efflux RND transporter periplasmic adaptor subunit n=1 Tax=Nitrosomonas sp. PY1 TaxID=1803906 RepID=UPI001FC8766C|nr:efflux RND transporter periplasmic adaptor subunit [Nitrosomonas sp. PY1]GKS68738.1 hemolysin D [Nitrosomonas sp. PY1]
MTYIKLTIKSEVDFSVRLNASVGRKKIIFLRYLSTLFCLLLISCGKDTNQPVSTVTNAVPVSFIVAQPVDLPVTLETIAQTEGAKEVEIRPQVGGILLKRLYDEGMPVKAGEQLYLIDPEPYKNALAEANAVVQEQQARITLAREDLKQQHQLYEKGFISRRAYDLVKTELAVIETALQSARARARQAQLNYSYTLVKAPVSGVTGRSQFSEGTLVSANTSVLTTISQLNPIWVRFSFSENEIMQFGDYLNDENVHNITLVLPDGAEYPLPGRINFAASQIDMALATQQIRATFENPEQRVLSGQFVRVRVTAGKVHTVYRIPQLAVLTSDLGKYVYVINDDLTVSSRSVKVGRWVGEDWLIEAGLNSGDRIAVDNLMRLAPGRLVIPRS